MVLKMNSKLGKIASARFGYGGYQDAQFGLSLEFICDGWGCGTFCGAWSIEIEVGPQTKWTETDRDAEFAACVRRLNNWMRDANVRDVSALVGIPVECTFENNTLVAWRVLKEVL